MDCSNNHNERPKQKKDEIACPTKQEWNSILDQECSESERQFYSLHLDNCAECRDLLKSLNEQSQRQFNSMIALIDGQPIFNKGQTLPDGLIVAGRQISGGSSVVVKAWDNTEKRFVAVKMSIQWLRDSESDIRKMMNEAEAIELLDHPNIVRLYETYPDFHPPAIVMEWVEGETLAKRLKQTEPTLDETLELIIEITGAVRHAHEHGILHRDIKPSNVLLSGERFGRPKLCDFGLAKFSSSNGDWSTATEFVGTPVFMAPEAFRNESGKIGPATDVYSIGAVLYQLLTRKTPFEGTNPIDLGIQVLSKTVVAPRQIRRDVPSDLERICLKCLMKDPDERYQDVASLESDLRRFQNGQSISVRADSQIKRIRRWAKHDPKSAIQAFSFVGLLILMVVSLAFLLQMSRTSERRSVENELLAMKNAEQAKQRLSESVEAMSLASPLIKELLSKTNPQKLSIEKIVKFATLRENIGVEPEDLTERLRFHYVMLEIADALRKIEGYREKAQELAETVRNNIGRLLKTENERMSKIVVFQKPEENFVFTLLEKAEIQYAHSCALVFYCIDEGVRGKNKLEDVRSLPHLNFLEEAIEHAKTALSLNSMLDEAKGDIANYQITLAEIHTARGELDIAEDYLKKAFKTSEELVGLYPKDLMRWDHYIHHLERLARLRLNEPNGMDRFLSFMSKLEKDYDQLRNSKFAGSDNICRDILHRTDLKYRIECRLGNKQKALQSINLSIQRHNEIAINKPNEMPLSSAQLDLFIDRLFLYSMLGRDLNVIEAEQHRIEGLIAEIKSEDVRKTYLARLYLYHPLNKSRDYKKSNNLLAQVVSANDNTDFLKQLSDLANDSKPVVCGNISNHIAQYRESENKSAVMLKILFETELLFKSMQIKTATEYLDLLKSWIDKDKLTSLFVIARQEELVKTIEQHGQ